MVILVRYAEIGIKGKNRDRFEKVLVANIDACLKANNISFTDIRRLYGRIVIETGNPCTCLKQVFGIASFSQAKLVGKTIEEITSEANKLVSNLTEKDSFRVSCQRLDKTFPLKSQEVCIQLGSKLSEVTKAKVQMKNPTVNVELEIINNIIYLMTDRIEGPGGMPLNTQDKVIALIEDENSVIAALLVMKRGCTVVPVMLNEIDIALLRNFSCGIPINTENIKSIDELAPIVGKNKVQAVVLNDTFDNIRQLSLNALILRPLSGYSIEEINNERQSFNDLCNTN